MNCQKKNIIKKRRMRKLKSKRKNKCSKLDFYSKVSLPKAFKNPKT